MRVRNYFKNDCNYNSFSKLTTREDEYRTNDGSIDITPHYHRSVREANAIPQTIIPIVVFGGVVTNSQSTEIIIITN